MTELRTLDIGSAIGDILSYIFKNIPTIVKATIVPTAIVMAIVFYWFLPQFFPLIETLIEYADYGDDQILIGAVFTMLGSLFLILILSLVFYGVTLVPLLRHAIFNEPVGLIRFDGLVFRAMAGMIIITAILYGVVFVLMVPVGIIQAILESSGSTGSAIAVEAFATLIMYALMAFIMVKTSLILPDIVASGRLRIANGWRASKGNFWRMLLTYFVIYIIVTLIVYVGIIVGFLIVGVAVATNTAVTNMDWENVSLEMVEAAYNTVMFSPAGFLMIVIFALTSMFSIGAYAGMFGVVYRMIVGEPQES